jgi:hypothetical protein
MNYRSVVVLGRATPILDSDEKLSALRTLVDHLLPGRWDEARLPSRKELKATLILAVSLAESSAKVRTGPPTDDEADIDLPIWAGEIPLRTVALQSVADPALDKRLTPPASIEAFLDERVRSIGNLATNEPTEE